MTEYTIRATIKRPYKETVEAVRGKLSDAGFGVLTEIDIKATLKNKLDVDVAPQVILGACRPELEHRALQVEPSIAPLLPCNVARMQGGIKVYRGHRGRQGTMSRLARLAGGAPGWPSLSTDMVTSTRRTCTCTSTGSGRSRSPHVRTICD